MVSPTVSSRVQASHSQGERLLFNDAQPHHNILPRCKALACAVQIGHRDANAQGPTARVALEGKGPQRQPQKRLDRRLEEVAEAVEGGACRLQMPLSLAPASRETVAGRRLGALEGGGGIPPPPLQGAQPMPSYVSLAASAGFNGICNRH